MKSHKNSYLYLLFILGFIILLGGAVLFVFAAFAQKEKSDMIIAFGMSLLDIACIFILGSCCRFAFSKLSFSQEGVLSRCLWCKDILIRWDECKDIGVAVLPRGYGLYTAYIYFSKEMLTQKQISNISGVKFNQNGVWTQYSKEIMEDILQYIPAERIRNKLALPQKEWIAWLSPPNHLTK